MSSLVLVYPFFRLRRDRTVFRFPPLGLGYLAASARRRGFKVDLLDCTFMDRESALARLRLIKADVIGMYVMVTMQDDALWLARELRSSGAFLAAGGPLPTVYPSFFLDHFDAVAVGEGDETICELLSAREAGRALETVPGLALRRNGGELVFSGKRPLSPDLDQLPFPARDLFPNRSYVDFWKKRFGEAKTTIFTTRGCPYNCEFCSNAVFGISYRERTVENVVDEVEQVLSQGYGSVHFADDVFTLDKERVFGICREIRRRKLHLRWECLGRVDSVDLELAKAMREAGCQRIYFGIESGDDKILKLMKKKTSVSQARRAVEDAHRAGIQTGGFFIVCYPGESDETVLSTLSFASSLPLDYLSFTVPYPIPGTALYERVKASVNKNWTLPDGFFSDHVLTFDADFSEFKMKFAILKGNLQFKLRKKSGRGLSVLAGPFEAVSDALFRILK